jgi:hypothetical protein
MLSGLSSPGRDRGLHSEETWDCHCHSCFDTFGKALNGAAMTNLQFENLRGPQANFVVNAERRGFFTLVVDQFRTT